MIVVRGPVAPQKVHRIKGMTGIQVGEEEVFIHSVLTEPFTKPEAL